VLSFEHYEMSSLPPPTPALQRILSGDRQSIMTEVSQIDATGSAVLAISCIQIKVAQKAADSAEKKAETARKRAASRTSTATPTKRIYKPKRAS